MIDDNRVYEILTEICEGVSQKRSKRGFVSRCPICGDSNKSKRIRRLHTDYYPKYDDWVVVCYNGGCSFHSGNIYSLYATAKGLSFIEAKKYIKENVYDSEAITKTLLSSNNSTSSAVVNQTEEIDLEWEYIVTPTQEVTDRFQQRCQRALNTFISDRCIPDVYASRMVAAFDGRYKGRVIIPIYIDGVLRYFQGRSLFSNIEPKYLNPDIDKDMIISNIDMFDRDKYIIVTEGLIDSWMVEHHQGTSVNGGYFSDEVIKELLGLTDKGVILVPDNPNIDKAGKETLIKFMNESRYSGVVRYYIIKGTKYKDLNDIVVDNPNIYIYDTIVAESMGKFATEMKLSLIYW